MGAASNGFGRSEPLTNKERIRIIENLGNSKEEAILAKKNVELLVDMVDQALQTAYLHQIPAGFDWRSSPTNIKEFEKFGKNISNSVKIFLNHADRLRGMIEQYCSDVSGYGAEDIAIRKGEADYALNEAASDLADEGAADLIRESLSLLAGLSPRAPVRRSRSRPPADDELRYLARAVCHWREMEGLPTQYYWRGGGNRTTVLIEAVAAQFGVHLDKARVATHLRNYKHEINQRPDGGTGQDDFNDFWA